MDTFSRYLEAKGFSGSSTATTLREAGYFEQWCTDEQLSTRKTTYLEVLGYIKALQQRGIKQITIQKYISSLKHFFAWQRKQGLRETNPAQLVEIKGVKRSQLYTILSRPELDSLYQQFPVPDPTHPCSTQNWFVPMVLAAKRNKVMVGLVVFQGLTTTDLQALTLSDVQLQEGLLTVPGSRRSNARQLPLAAIQMVALIKYVHEVRPALLCLSGKDSNRLLVSVGSGQRLSTALQRLQIQLPSIHPAATSLKQLRASVITHWLKTTNLRQAQYLAGHRYVSSTESYLVNDLEGLQEDVGRFHPLG